MMRIISCRKRLRQLRRKSSCLADSLMLYCIYDVRVERYFAPDLIDKMKSPLLSRQRILLRNCEDIERLMGRN